MNRIFYLVLALILISACKKEKTRIGQDPKMKYIDLHRAEVKPGTFQRLDMDEDGSYDFNFKTLLIGDPVLRQDRLAFLVGSTIENYLAIIDNSQTGTRLNKGDAIGLRAPHGYEWFHIGLIVMTEKITSEATPPYWRGTWQNASLVMQEDGLQ